ncbi:hypothetical protein BH10ACI1_BH10ACI1_03560 [soil metagenome]
MKKFLIISFILLVSSANVFAQTKPAMLEIDRIRIAEAFRIGEKLQNKIWKNWEKAPFSMLFITDDYEFLIRHPKPSDEFSSIGYDTLLKSEVFVRPRKFQKNFLATFPAFSRTPVIVVGKAENTSEKTSTRWVFVVLHEHFHQLQYSQTTYFEDVDALNLSGGDTTGMWQINFAFPYKTKEVSEKFRELTDLLVSTYNSANQKQRAEKLKEYLAERENFRRLLSANDYKYASFQLWQEGIARYTQYRMAELAGRKIKPSKEFRTLPDFTSFKSEAERLFSATFTEMKELDLAEWERNSFYPFGAIEGLLLDKINPNWRKEYFVDKFALEKFYSENN